MRYTVQARAVKDGEWREVGTYRDAAYCMRLAEAWATEETETRIVPAIALAGAPPLCRFRRTPTGAVLVEESDGRRHLWQAR